MTDATKIIITAPSIKTANITLYGDSELCLNKMNDCTVRKLTDERKDKAKKLDKDNPWEEIITAVHWLNPLPATDRSTWDEETMHEILATNKPCISAFGLKKSWMAAVVRNGIDTYSTKFDASVNVIADNNLVPVDFSEWQLSEQLMSPKKGAPVLARLNHFKNWSAKVTIQYTENTYSLEQILSIINLAGFGLGIGSGRSSGYGRYHVGN